VAVLPLWSDLPPDQTYPRAKAAALEALLAEPFAALGDVNAMYEWNWAAAEKNFRRSLALDPNNANTRHWYNGDLLMTVGRLREGVEQARRARELDPLSVLINAAYGQALYRVGRLDEAAVELRNVVSLDPDFTLANLWLGQVYLLQGHAADAIPFAERAIDPRSGTRSTWRRLDSPTHGQDAGRPRRRSSASCWTAGRRAT
jgi:predicted Zn-dependent protease